MTEATSDTRDALRNRILPQMILSDATNPLTKALPLTNDADESPPMKAIKRFAVVGNAIITGGAGTLGLEAARGLLEHGATGICLVDLATTFHISQERINRLVAEFPMAKVKRVVADVTDYQGLQTAVSAVAEELGGVEILLCFAGVVGCTHALEMTEAQWKRTLDINLSGSWYSAKAVASEMIKRNTGGRIVFIASISGHRVNFPQPQVAYNASKAGLLQLKNSLAAEWARYGIRVNSISPGYMDTILNEGEGLAAARKIWAERNPMGRMGNPEELVGTIVLLCSAAGQYINGADIIVDGGGHVF